ncbi:MAG TPA: hypothetical protein VFQ78_00235 [Candidatus Udaeobacter sp.]|nr:hypothetical protein [Candidatus Udaeobacter sp.]
MFVENPGFTLNADNITIRLISSRWLCVPVAMLFFFSGPCVNADAVSDFFKRVGDSVSKAFQPRPTPNPNQKKTKHAAHRLALRNPNVAGASPTPLEEPTVVVKQETVTPSVTVMRASGVPAEKAKGDMPYGIPVPGHKGMVTSPYVPDGNYIDVRGFAAGSAVKDPYTGRLFLVP